MMLGSSGEVLPAASKPVRPTIHVQLDVKGSEEDASNGNCGGNDGDPVTATAAPSLRVSFTGAKRSDLSLFRASSPAVSEHQVPVCECEFLCDSLTPGSG